MSKKASRPLWLRILGGFVYLTFCLAVIGAASLLGWIGQSKVASALTRQYVMRTEPEQVFSNSSALNILLLGCDEDRAYGGKKILRENARSDMILCARLDFKNNRISGISIPRDLLVRVPGYREQKINAYHAIGGKQLAKEAVETVLGIPIDRVVVLNYAAFQEMVDLVGGVEVFVQKPLKYTDRRGGLFIDIKPGRHKLDGYDAMCFVRYRHGDSDFARQDRQKDFLLAFKEAMLKRPGLITSVAEKARDVMGGELNAEELAALILFARSVGNDNVKMGQVPTVPARRYDLALDRTGLRKTLRDLDFIDTDRTTFRYDP